MNKSELKILQAPHFFLPNIGGIEFYVYRLARDLIESHYTCKVVTSGDGCATKIDKIPVEYLKNIKLLPRNPFLIGLISYLKSYRPNVVHIHSIWFLPSLQLCLLKNTFGYKVVNTVHGVYPDQTSVLVKIFLAFFCEY